MIFEEAMRSLFHDKAKSLFYWIVFVITIMFIFLFCNVGMSDAIGMTFINSGNDMGTNITLYIIILCVIEIFFANSFYVRSKSSEMALHLLCGATFVQVAGFLLIQIFVLLLASIPVAVGLATALIPFVSKIFSTELSSVIVMNVRGDACVVTTVILSIIMLWTTYLNCSFAYKNVIELLNKSESSASPFATSLDQSLMIKIILYFFFILIMVFPLLLPMENSADIFTHSLLSYGGFFLVMMFVLPCICDVLMNVFCSRPVLSVAVGYFRSDVKDMTFNFLLLTLGSVALDYILMMQNTGDVTLILFIVSYVMLNVLVSSAFLFKFLTIVSQRKLHYKTFSHIGYLDTQKQSILILETILVYLFGLSSTYFYLSYIFNGMISFGYLSESFKQSLLLMFAIPFGIGGIVGIFIYRKSVYQPWKVIVEK